MGTRVTAQDVARRAGVSRATVSFVLNDAPGQSISDATRDSVRTAARELGYVPSAAAQILRSGSSRLVLCLEPDWEPSVLMDRAIATLSSEFEGRGYAMVVSRTGAAPSAPNVLVRSVSPCAVVAMYDLPKSVRTSLQSLLVPVEEAWFHSSGGQRAADDFQGLAGSLQVEHLIARGAQRIVVVAPRTVRESEVRDDRIRGVVRAAVAAGRNEPDVVLVDSLDADGLRPIRDALRAGAGPVGVCAFNDLHGAAVLLAARDLGLHAPREVLVIGVDDDQLALLTRPQLSTVRFDVKAHMRALAARVVARAEGRDGTGDVLEAPVRVVQREST
ncbi:LacI family DNA-binding transcriptional regulator [Curtobacterium sp. NPDC089689]|uniref:LacI family DNA-binding transcriptional regulator n=1 Tax=Curtobacterium sp. NPDC089689 TaxID=3363968 RepID=UPI0037FFE2E5